MTCARRRLLLSAAALPALAVALAAGWIWLDLVTPHADWEGSETVVVLERGMPASAMLARLGDAGVLRRVWPLRLWLMVRGGAERLSWGEYRFQGALAPVDVLQMLEHARVWLHPVTIPEGLTIDETARRFAEAGLADQHELLEAFRDPTALRDPKLEAGAESLEGFLFPDTYHFARDVSTNEIRAAMIARFRRFYTGGETTYGEASERVGLSALEAVTLASMIERETSLEEERARVSRVFHNRLARGMRLQSDPTVRYSLERAGRAVERLLTSDLRFESRWNTYVIDGLPPGPICSPGARSLWAAVKPAEGEDLYFVAKPGGGHRFSPDLASHRRAVLEWRDYLRSSR